MTSAINKKNEERTAARLANTGKVLRTVSFWHAGSAMMYLMSFLQAIACKQLPVIDCTELALVYIQVQQLPVKASAEQKKRAKAVR